MSELPVPNWAQTLPAYIELCKPRIVAMLVFTAIIGMLLASPAPAPLSILLWGSVGIWLAGASAAVINHVVDEKVDAVMARTRRRPLPSGVIRREYALGFAFVLSAFSMIILTAFVNALTAVLTLFSLIGYGFVYSMYLKRATPQNIVIGGVAGAAPPLLGWTAVTGAVDPGALLLFLIIFAWTPPHFWALAVYRREEYATAGIPMLPVTHGVGFTCRYIVLYTIVLILISMLPYVIRMSGEIYLTVALLLGAGFLYHALGLLLNPSDGRAIRTFAYSIFYLMALFSGLLLDHYLPYVIQVRF